MLKNLVIKNYQAHESTQLDFFPGVNAIIGESDCGKSSIFRALNWLVNNRPVGDGFRSHFAVGTDTKVSLSTDDGIIISRIKGDKDNTYILNGNTLKAFGTEVPEDVKVALAISELNLQKQMDAPFLLSESPGEVARILNQIANIDNIDASLKRIDSSIRSNKSEISFNETELEKSEKELKKVEWVLDAERDFENIKHSETSYQHKKEMFDELLQLINKSEFIKFVKYDIKKAEKDIENINDLVGKHLKLLTQTISIKNKINDFLKIEIINYDTQLAMTDINKIRIKDAEISNIKKAKIEISDLVLSYENKKGFLREMKEDIIFCEKRIKELAPEMCPVCGQRWLK